MKIHALYSELSAGDFRGALQLENVGELVRQ